MQPSSKYGSRKFIVVLLALLVIFVLALLGKLDVIAGAAIAGAISLYNRANLQQRREQLSGTTAPEAAP